MNFAIAYGIKNNKLQKPATGTTATIMATEKKMCINMKCSLNNKNKIKFFFMPPPSPITNHLI